MRTPCPRPKQAIRNFWPEKRKCLSLGTESLSHDYDYEIQGIWGSLGRSGVVRSPYRFTIGGERCKNRNIKSDNTRFISLDRREKKNRNFIADAKEKAEKESRQQKHELSLLPSLVLRKASCGNQLQRAGHDPRLCKSTAEGSTRAAASREQ